MLRKCWCIVTSDISQPKPFLSGGSFQSDNDEAPETVVEQEQMEEKEKTDQSQQTTPTTPPADTGKYVLRRFSSQLVCCKFSLDHHVVPPDSSFIFYILLLGSLSEGHPETVVRGGKTMTSKFGNGIRNVSTLHCFVVCSVSTS